MEKYRGSLRACVNPYDAILFEDEKSCKLTVREIVASTYTSEQALFSAASPCFRFLLYAVMCSLQYSQSIPPAHRQPKWVLHSGSTESIFSVAHPKEATPRRSAGTRPTEGSSNRFPPAFLLDQRSSVAFIRLVVA